MVAQISCAVSVGAPLGDDACVDGALHGGDEALERAGADAEGVVTRLEPGDGPEEHHLVRHRVGDSEGPVAAGALTQRLEGVVDLAHGGHLRAEAFEALDEERLDDPELRLEVVVDAHRRHVGGGGDPAHREPVGALGLEDVGG